ncbi:MAG: hypothetical protein KA535_06925 [Azonexus sp.]|nr:hypothetical protein [Azonexus sp.]
MTYLTKAQFQVFTLPAEMKKIRRAAIVVEHGINVRLPAINSPGHDLNTIVYCK